MKAYIKTFVKFTEIFIGKYEYLGFAFLNDDNLPFSFGDNEHSLVSWTRFKEHFQKRIDEHNFGHEDDFFFRGHGIRGKEYVQVQWEEIIAKVENSIAAWSANDLLIDLEG